MNIIKRNCHKMFKPLLMEIGLFYFYDPKLRYKKLQYTTVTWYALFVNIASNNNFYNSGNNSNDYTGRDYTIENLDLFLKTYFNKGINSFTSKEIKKLKRLCHGNTKELDKLILCISELYIKYIIENHKSKHNSCYVSNHDKTRKYPSNDKEKKKQKLELLKKGNSHEYNQ